MNEKAKPADSPVSATRSVWRCTYTFAGKNDSLRSGAILVDAISETEAKAAAEIKLAAFGLRHSKVTNAAKY